MSLPEPGCIRCLIVCVHLPVTQGAAVGISVKEVTFRVVHCFHEALMLLEFLCDAFLFRQSRFILGVLVYLEVFTGSATALAAFELSTSL